MKSLTRFGTVLAAATLLSSPLLAADNNQINGGAANAGGFNGGISVPEVDAAGAMLALALMGGIVAIVGERRRRHSR